MLKQFRTYFWTTGQPWHSIRQWVLPRILRVFHSLLMATLRLSTTGMKQSMAHLGGETGVIFICWHDDTLMPLHLFRHKNVGVMMSTSHSGQTQAAFWRLYGWPTFWGSTKKREGIKAVREVLRALRAGQSFAFTPDGPKGPRHFAHPGVIYLAANAPTVLMPMGLAASSYWRLPTWDKFFIPKPFSRVHMHIGAPLSLPEDSPRVDTELWQQRITKVIEDATEEAERQLKERTKSRAQDN